MSMPKLLAVVASRRNSVQRSWLVASRRQPVIFQPVARSVSFLEPLVEIDRVSQQARDRCRRTKLANKAGRMPGRAGCQLALFEQHHIGLVVAGQMIGCRATDNAAADYDDLGMGR